jgi:Flp pilus assembly protein TadD
MWFGAGTFFSLPLLLALLSDPSAVAADSALTCFAPDASPAEKIAACSILIDDSTRSPAVRAEAFVARAASEMASGNIEGAIADDTAALNLTPKNTDALTGRAEAEMSRDPSAAEVDLTVALARNGSLAHAYLERSVLRLKRGDTAATIADLTQARRLAPNDTEILTHLGAADLRANRNGEAVDVFTAILRLHPDDAAALHGRATAYGRLGNLTAASADFSAILAAAPDDREALMGRGVAALQAGRAAEAIGDFTRVVAKNPSDVEALFDRAAAEAKAGRRESALADFESAQRLKPDDPDIRAALVALQKK